MPSTTPGETFVLLCDWRGQFVWASGTKHRLKVGEYVWSHLTVTSRETTQAAIARVVTLRENQSLVVENDCGMHYRTWLWPLNSPEVAVCVLGIRIPQELARLSEREIECLSQLAQGRSTREIAKTLGISISTTHTHLRRSREKLKLRTTEALIGFAAKYCQPAQSGVPSA